MNYSLDKRLDEILNKKLAEIRKQYEEIGGVWLVEYHQRKLGICLFFAKFCAYLIIKGDFDLSSRIEGLVHLLERIKKESEFRDSLMLRIHEEIAQLSNYQTLVRAIGDYLILKKAEPLMKLLNEKSSNLNIADLLKSSPGEKRFDEVTSSETYNLLTKNFHEFYRHEFMRRFMLLEQNPTLKELHDQSFPGLIVNVGEDVTLQIKNGMLVLSDEQFLKFLPQFGSAVNIFLWEPHRFSFSLQNNTVIANNVSLNEGHYISICFNYFKQKPTLFICNADFGVLLFTDIHLFRRALNTMLNFCITAYDMAEPHCFNDRLCHVNSQPRKVMSCNDWLNKFYSGSKEAPPTAGLISQASMPGWAKIIANHLQSYEKSLSHPWNAIHYLFNIKNLLLDERIRSQYLNDKFIQNHVEELLQQLDHYFSVSITESAAQKLSHK